jgi:hypothetical protein
MWAKDGTLRPIGNRLPGSREKYWEAVGILRTASGRPIANRPQVANLPHKKIVAACEETDEL